MKNNNFNKKRKSLLLTACLTCASIITANSAVATIVQFQTNMGNFDVNLYDQRTPKTVANFLAYVEAGDYTNAISHRAVANFIVQGGGFTYNNSWPVDAISANPSVENEPVFSNVRGSIAMAKLGGLPDSATNQWFFNLADNSGGNPQLDSQNAGFTVFGEVMADGMSIIDQIAGLQKFNFGGALTDLPLQNFANNGIDPNETNLVIITSIIILDASTDTAASLTPPLNTASIPPPTPPPAPPSSGGGGSMGAFLSLVLLFGLRKKARKQQSL